MKSPRFTFFEPSQRIKSKLRTSSAIRKKSFLIHFATEFKLVTGLQHSNISTVIFFGLTHEVPIAVNRKLVYVFPEMKLRGLIPITTFMFAVSDLYIPRISLPIWLQKIGRPILHCNPFCLNKC